MKLRSGDMKLRSGKILFKEFPPKLDVLDKLVRTIELMLQDFKTMTSENPKHARELLDLISQSNNSAYGYAITGKITEAYDNNEKTMPLRFLTGKLFGLMVFEYPQYHDIMEAKIKNFDLETTLTGEMEE